MSLYKRGEIWWVYLGRGGQRVRRSTHTTVKKKAQKVHDQIADSLWRQGELGHKADHTWAEALKVWLKESTRGEPDKARLSAFNRSFGNPALRDITPHMVDLALSGKSPPNKSRYLGIIIAVLNLAKRKGLVNEVPHFDKPKSPKGRVRWLTAEQWKKLLSHLTGRQEQMARFAISTGLRRHNVTHLEWAQVDMKRKVAWIHPDQSKSGDPIGIPLSIEAMGVLKERAGLHETWVFDYNGEPAERTFTKAFKRALVASGIEDFRWHDLRHTWASWHCMGGTRLEELQQLGGWKTLQMVQRYAHLSSEHLAGVANNARPVSMAAPIKFRPRNKKKR